MSIKAVVFDLDDTLYPEIEYVKSGYNAVGKFIADKYTISKAAEELFELFKEDIYRVFDRFLKRHSLPVANETITELLDIYRNHKPTIKTYSDVKPVLERLRNNGYGLGIITDGRSFQQRLKIQSLGLSDLVDCIIITDELGGESFWKPSVKPFELMSENLGIELSEMAYVGDNPAKDFYIGVKQVFTVRLKRKDTLHYYDSEYYMNVKEKLSVDGLM